MRPELKAYAYKLKTIDSHTVGESTRIVYEGFPPIEGNTMMEKKQYVIEHYDYLRTALMLEPRGHRDMFGAVLTEPVHEEADYGVIFMDSGSYLNMCGHGSIGTASMLVETGMVEVTEPYIEVVLDAPSGIIRTRVHVVDGRAVEASILNVPSFLYMEDQKVFMKGWGEITYDISFGGSFFALVDAEKIGLNLEMENVDKITELGMALRDIINNTVEIRHPYLDITTVDLVEFYSHTQTVDADMKNCVIFGNAQADRSPCGTGTSAKLATLYTKGELGLGEEFVYESITGSLFKGIAVQEVEIAGRKGIIPQITGSAYITGLNEWIIDERDPLAKGFLLGTKTKKDGESIRGIIVRAAWELFHEKGFQETSVEDIVERAAVSEESFYKYFDKKEDLEHTLGELFDAKYSELIISMDSKLSQYDKLIYLNRELFTLIEDEVPFELLKHVYVTEPVEQQEMLDHQRFYYQLIPQIMEEGIKNGEFHTDESAGAMAETYASIERGLIYDWCVKDGKDSLVRKGKKVLAPYLERMLA